MGVRAGTQFAVAASVISLAVGPASGEARSDRGARTGVELAAARQSLIPARAVSVLDARTIRVRALTGKRRSYKVRLVGLAAGSKNSTGCSDAKTRARLASLLFKRGKGVRLRLKLDSTKKRYDGDGRLRAYVYRRTGPALQILLLRKGEAKLQGGSGLRLYRSLKRAEGQAKVAALGVWKRCLPPPASGLGGPVNPSALPPASDKRPNILFIVTDDQAQPETMQVMPKTLGWFADEGTTYPQAVATTPLCCPSRASIFSGRYAHNHGVLQNSGRGELDLRYTIQRYLHDAGYMTGIVGKFLNYWERPTGPDEPPRLDDPPDFDRWALSSGLYNPLWVNEQGTSKWVTQYSTSYFKDRSLAFVREASGAGNPWFLHLAVTAPHTVHDRDIPPRPEEKYQNAQIPDFVPSPNYFESDIPDIGQPPGGDKPPWVRGRRTPEQIQDQRAGALRTLMSVDDMVDEVFTELERIGKADNTLAFFLSDNGYMLGEHKQIGKSSPFLESLRIPLFMRWPAGSPAGAVDERFVANIDLVPTVLQASGASAPPQAPVDGRSLLDRSWARDHVALEHWNVLNDPDPNSPIQTFGSILTRGYQYTEWYEEDAVTPKQWAPAAGGGPVREYYDLSSDPWQLTNLLHDGNPNNDPAVDSISTQLARDRICAGHGPENAEPPPCP